MELSFFKQRYKHIDMKEKKNKTLLMIFHFYMQNLHLLNVEEYKILAVVWFFPSNNRKNITNDYNTQIKSYKK